MSVDAALRKMLVFLTSSVPSDMFHPLYPALDAAPVSWCSLPMGDGQEGGMGIRGGGLEKKRWGK